MQFSPAPHLLARVRIVQQFNDKGECVNQDFILGGNHWYFIKYEYEDGNETTEIHKEDMPYRGNENFPIKLLQPGQVMVDSKTYFRKNE